MLVGREAEVAELDALVGGSTPAHRALIVTGEAGIGKTTVWETGLDTAGRLDVRVLSVRATEPESELSYVSLGDLLAEVASSELTGLPPPQLRALEVALLRVEPDGVAPEPLAVAAGLAGALRALSAQQPVLIAVDDVPWLDGASHTVLAYAARRLGSVPVRFLLARRPGDPSKLEQALGPEATVRVELRPLSLGATRAMLLSRLDLTLPRRVLNRVCQVTEGNPLYALELGRRILELGTPEIGAELPVPKLADDPFHGRFESLPGGVRRALLATAVAGSLDRRDLASVVEEPVIDEALAGGVLILDGERIRAAHPLLLAAARTHSSEGERREMHLALAEAVSDLTLRVRHRAVAASSPDAELAESLADAAESAVARGASHDAVDLARHALRLTPSEAPEHATRMLELARYLVIAGEMPRARPLLETAVGRLPPGPARGRAYLQLGECAHTVGEWADFVDKALANSDGDPALRVTALATRTMVLAATMFRHFDKAEQSAEEAMELAQERAPETAQWAACALAWIRLFRGRPLDDLRARFGAPPVGASLYENSLDRVYGTQLVTRGPLDEARSVFERLRLLADQRGEARSGLIMHMGLVEVELRGGNALAAARLIEESDEWAVFEDVGEVRARCEAFLALIRGDADTARRWAEEAMVRSEQVGMLREWLEGMRLSGAAALLEHDPERAAAAMRAVWGHMESEGIADPTVFPVAPDLVEALIELGATDEATTVTDRLHRLAEEQAHPSGLAGARRCRALLRLAAGIDLDDAEEELAAAAEDHSRLGFAHDSARCLLALGRGQRRLRRWGRARSSLERAAEAFEALGAPGWAVEARSELARVGGRRRSDSSPLTLTEKRIAELAAGGRSNKEIAAELVVSVNTVEKHLSHTYSKLGVRSRGQLAALLAALK